MRKFDAGDQVWFYNPQRKKGISPKMQPNWEGLYVIVKRINDCVYRIRKSPRGKLKIVHIDRLAPYDEQLKESTRMELGSRGSDSDSDYFLGVTEEDCRRMGFGRERAFSKQI